MKLKRISKVFGVISCFLVGNLFLATTDEDINAIKDRIESIINAPPPSLPKYGTAILKAIHNNSPFGVSITKSKSIYDFLPEGTVVNLKAKNGKYYTVKKRMRPNGSEQIVCAADGIDKESPDARFTVHQYFDYSLNPYITFSPNVESLQNKVMGVDPNGKVVFEQSEFNDEDGRRCHWIISPEISRAEPDSSQLNSIWLVNRQNQGVLKTDQRTESLRPANVVTEPASFNAVWGTTKAGIEKSSFVTYNSLVRLWIESEKDCFLWTHDGPRRADLGQYGADMILAGDTWADKKRYSGAASFFILRKEQDFDNYGIVFSGDRFEIISPWATQADSKGKMINPPGYRWYAFKSDWSFIEASPPNYAGTTNGDQIFSVISSTMNIIEFAQPIKIRSENTFFKGYVHRAQDRWAYSVVYEIFAKDPQKPGGRDRSEDPKYNTFRIERVLDIPQAQQIIDAYGLNKRSDLYCLKNVQEWEKRGGQVAQIAVYGYEKTKGTNNIAFDLWAIGDTANQLWHAKDGIGWDWQYVADNVRYVALGGEDESPVPWVIKTDNTIHKFTKDGLFPIPGAPSNVRQIALKSQNEAWAIDFDGHIWYCISGKWDDLDKYAGEKKEDDPALKNKPISISVSAFPGDEKEVWIVREDGNVYRYNKDSKVWGQVTQFGTKMMQVAIQKYNDVYGTDRNRNIWHFDGKNVTQMPGKLATIAVANGAYSKTVGKVEPILDTFTTAWTLDKNGNKFVPSSDALIEINTLEAGKGKGKIGEKSTEIFEDIPVSKNPRVEGFALKDWSNIDLASYDLDLIPLINRGAAWIKTSFDNPGRASITFYAKANEGGNIEVVFGNQIQPEVFVWKVIIGADGNSQAKIVKYKDGVESLIMDPVTRQQNPLAIAAPGRVMPYWVSVDMNVKDPSKGAWIAVGRSADVGKNLIMACRDPQPPSTVTFVGFSTNKDPVRYSQVRIGDPVVVKPPARVYITRKDAISINPGKTINWKDWERLPFRIADQGTIQCKLQGTRGVMLALSTTPKDNAKHYAIVFGNNNNQELVVQKWDTKTNKYQRLGGLSYSQHPDLALDPQKPTTFWVSYNEGLIIIGKGSKGHNPVIVVNDVDPYNGIETIGFAAWEDLGATVSDVEVAPEVSFGYATKKEGYYERAKQLPSMRGDVEILLPFIYVFKQNQDSGSVVCEDLVTGKKNIIISTPQQGAIYPFIVQIDKSGAARLEKFENPYNPVAELWKRRIQRLDIAKQDLEQKMAAATKAGEAAKTLSAADADRYRKYAEAGQKTAADLTTAGIGMISAGGAISTEGGELINPVAATSKAVVIGAGVASVVGGLVRGGLTEIDARQAADKEFEGAQSVAAAEKRVAEIQDFSNRLEIEKQMLEGDAKFAFRGHDTYSYVDKPTVRELGSATIPSVAQENKKQLIAALKSLDSLKSKLKSVDALEAYLTYCENIMTLINHYYVVAEAAIKQRIWDSLKILRDVFMEASAKIPEKLSRTRMRLVKVLFSALNNSFLADNQTISNQWYVWINEIMRDVLAQSDKQAIELPAQYAEYIWIPQEFKNNEGVVTFLVKGNSDLFVALSPVAKRLRNDPQQEFYEILIGGWDNTKSVIRLKSLDRPAKEFSIKKYPELKLDPFQFKQMWIMYKDGMISGGFGAPGIKPMFSWKDPYPIKGIRYIGLSTWDSPLIIKNIQVSSLDKMPALIMVTEEKKPAEEAIVEGEGEEEEEEEEEEEPEAEIVIEEKNVKDQNKQAVNKGESDSEPAQTKEADSEEAPAEEASDQTIE